MKLLAVDTASECCSAALWLDGDIRERSVLTRTGHSDILLPMVGALLAEAGLSLAALDGIAVDHGPGSFTGIRIGIGVCQGMAFGSGLPVVPVSSLSALARAAAAALVPAEQRARLLPALDARMGQVYWSAMAAPGRHEEGAAPAAVVSEPERVRVAAGTEPVVGIGSGWDIHHEILTVTLAPRMVRWLPQRLPTAGAVAAIGATRFSADAVAPERLEPLYVRDEVAKRRH
jgi:tRNA threonylcarbamoyladenosine biosynthesis protein TsaB